MTVKTNRLSPRAIILMLLVIVVIPLLPLLISGDWGWWEAWVYALINIFGFATGRALAARRHPDLIAERARSLQHENTKAWDKRLMTLLFLTGSSVPLVCGLDARFDWSPPFSGPAKMAALAMLVGGYVFSTYALIENRFFSGVVRIQTERDHQVVTSGPYRWLRHPGYAGALASYIATPVFLDSYWAFLPVMLVTVVLVIRTSLEDRTLQAELPGYSDYAKKTRFRLLPGVW